MNIIFILETNRPRQSVDQIGQELQLIQLE